MECGVVYKPKPGYYARIGYDAKVDPETGELGKPERMWKEEELYCAKFWIPLYKDETFRHYVESKFAFEEQVLINANEDVLALMNAGYEDLSENTGIAMVNRTGANLDELDGDILAEDEDDV